MEHGWVAQAAARGCSSLPPAAAAGRGRQADGCGHPPRRRTPQRYSSRVVRMPSRAVTHAPAFDEQNVLIVDGAMELAVFAAHLYAQCGAYGRSEEP